MGGAEERTERLAVLEALVKGWGSARWPTAVAFVDAGHALILQMKALPHGAVGPFLRQLGISPSFAQRMMRCSFRFAGADLAKIVKAVSASHLVELLTLSDDELRALASGKPVRGMTLGEIKLLKTRQLRDRLRIVDVIDGTAHRYSAAFIVEADEAALIASYRRCGQAAKDHVRTTADLLAAMPPSNPA